jgi:hypothetical protein
MTTRMKGIGALTGTTSGEYSKGTILFLLSNANRRDACEDAMLAEEATETSLNAREKSGVVALISPIESDAPPSRSRAVRTNLITCSLFSSNDPSTNSSCEKAAIPPARATTLFLSDALSHSALTTNPVETSSAVAEDVYV